MTLPSRLLHGKRIRLTALNERDVTTIARWDEDSRFLRLLGTHPAHPRSDPQIAKWLERVQDDHQTVVFGIRPLNGDDLIGTLELDGVLWSHRVCGMGLAIGDRDHWGHGYGYEAAQLGLAFAFNELNLHRVTGTVFSYNQRSIALIEKLGFQREGRFREFLERDGERHDMLLYGLLRHEWDARRRNA